MHIVPAWDPRPVGSTTTVQVEKLLTDLAVSRSVGAAARVRTTVRGLFGYAVRTRLLALSPAADVPVPRPDSRTGDVVEVNSLILAELLAVVERQRAFGGRYADVTLVLALTGVRMGELRGLRVRDVVVVP